MNSNKISDLLKQIQKFTGVSLSFDEAATFAGEEETVELLENIILPYKKRTASAVFLSSLLAGNVSDDEIINFLSDNHIPDCKECVIYIINTPKNINDTVKLIVDDLIEKHDFVISIDSHNLAILRLSSSSCSDSQIIENASSIIDTITADAMIPCNISFDGKSHSVFNAFESYNHALLAMSIGTRFFSHNTVHCYHKLGLEKLICQLSEEDCREYLSDHMNGFTFSSLDDELSSTVHAFFDAGLSVAQASRNMFIHRNTLLYRLEKFEKLSGLDLKKFDDAITAKIAMIIEMRLS